MHSLNPAAQGRKAVHGYLPSDPLKSAVGNVSRQSCQWLITKGLRWPLPSLVSGRDFQLRERIVDQYSHHALVRQTEELLLQLLSER